MLAIHANIESERLSGNISRHFSSSFSFLSPWLLQCREFGCAFHKVQSSQSTSSKAQKNLRSSLLQLSFLSPWPLQCREFWCVFHYVQLCPSLNLTALEILRSTHSVPFFPFGGEWRLRSKRNLESTLYQSEIPWCEHETQPVTLTYY